MGWEKCSIDLKIALITNSFGHRLFTNKRKVHAKNYVSKCRSFWPTVKRISKNRRPSILAKTLYGAFHVKTDQKRAKLHPTSPICLKFVLGVHFNVVSRDIKYFIPIKKIQKLQVLEVV